MNGDFWEDYDLRIQQVNLANYKTFSDRIRMWLKVLDSDQDARSETSRLESLVDLSAWREERDATIGGMIGSGQLQWPEQDENRLGMQLKLVRQWASSLDAAVNFSMDFFGETKYDDAVRDLIQQIFLPLTDDLKRHLSRLGRSPAPQPVAPASDRIVPLNHNSSQIGDALTAVTNVKTALEATNDYEDHDDKEQQIAELTAGESLLKAAKARVAAIKIVLIHCLKYIGEKFADHAIGALVTLAITALLAVFGIHIVL